MKDISKGCRSPCERCRPHLSIPLANADDFLFQNSSFAVLLINPGAFQQWVCTVVNLCDGGCTFLQLYIKISEPPMLSLVGETPKSLHRRIET